MASDHREHHVENPRLSVQNLYLIYETHEYLTLDQAQDSL